MSNYTIAAKLKIADIRFIFFTAEKYRGIILFQQYSFGKCLPILAIRGFNITTSIPDDYCNNLFKKRIRTNRIIKRSAPVIAIIILIYIISGQLDLFEGFADFSETHEKYQLDELILIAVFLMFYFLVNLILKSRDLNRKNGYIMENLAEKNLLLRESRHRQKNNINILLGLLKLEEKKFDTPQTREIYNKLVSRLESMGIIYDRLNNAAESDYISTKAYFETFFKKLGELYDDGRIFQELEIEDFEIHHEIISSLSIMVNELYTNSIKYVFPVRKKCIIYFSIEKNEDVVEIKYSDNGDGFENAADHEGFGLKLFHSLVKQLNAEVEIVDSRHCIKIKKDKLRAPELYAETSMLDFH